MKDLTTTISASIGCDLKTADEILQGELDYCQDLLDNGCLTYDDLEQICFDMGVESDYIEDIIERLL